MYPIHTIRQAFLGLSRTDEQGWPPLLLDGPGGSQLPKVVVDAMADYLYHFNSNLGGFAHAGRVTSSINEQARQAAADWLNGAPDQIFFGLNATSLMFHVARTLSQDWQAGQNIVVSSMDHFSHVSSWQLAAQDRGLEVRTIPLVADGSELDLTTLDRLIDDQTCLVATTLASNVLGTKTNIAPIVAKAKAVGAKVSVDAVHAIVHDCVDVAQLDCDVLFASTYKIGGPRLGLCFMKEGTLAAKRFYKVEPATNALPNAWEQGTQSFEAQAGLIALMDYWAGLGQVVSVAGVDLARQSRRDRLQAAYAVVAEHERSLTRAFLAAARQRSYLRLYGKLDDEGRTPTFAFNVFSSDGLISPAQVSAYFGEKNIALPCGNFYALDVVRHLDLVDVGFLRVGFLHYNSHQEVDRFFELLDDFMATVA